MNRKKNIVDNDKIKMPLEMKQLLVNCLSKDVEIADLAQKKLAKILEIPLIYNILEELNKNLSEYSTGVKDAQS